MVEINGCIYIHIEVDRGCMCIIICIYLNPTSISPISASWGERGQSVYKSPYGDLVLSSFNSLTHLSVLVVLLYSV